MFIHPCTFSSWKLNVFIRVFISSFSRHIDVPFMSVPMHWWIESMSMFRVRKVQLSTLHEKLLTSHQIIDTMTQNIKDQQTKLAIQWAKKWNWNGSAQFLQSYLGYVCIMWIATNPKNGPMQHAKLTTFYLFLSLAVSHSSGIYVIA